MLTAFYFGAGVVKDAFNVSQAIPTRIGSAFFGAINSSLVPYLIHLRNQEGEEAFWKAYSQYLPMASNTAFTVYSIDDDSTPAFHCHFGTRVL